MPPLPDQNPRQYPDMPDAYIIAGVRGLDREQHRDFVSHLAAIARLGGLSVRPFSPQEVPLADIMPFRERLRENYPLISKSSFIGVKEVTSQDTRPELGIRLWGALVQSQVDPNTPSHWQPHEGENHSLFDPILPPEYYETPYGDQWLNLEKLAAVLHETATLHHGGRIADLKPLLPRQLGHKSALMLCDIVNQMLEPADPVDLPLNNLLAQPLTADGLFLDTLTRDDRPQQLVTLQSFLRYVYGPNSHKPTEYMRPDLLRTFQLIAQEDRRYRRGSTIERPKAFVFTPEQFLKAGHGVVQSRDPTQACSQATKALLAVYLSHLSRYLQSKPKTRGRRTKA